MFEFAGEAPPSLNALWSVFGGYKKSIFLSPQTRKFRVAVAEAFRRSPQFEKGKLLGRLKCTYKSCRRDKRKKYDIDNLIKGCLDACTSIVYNDDAQIHFLQGSKCECRTCPTPFYFKIETLGDENLEKKRRNGFAGRHGSRNR